MVLNLVGEFARQGIQIDLLALKANSEHLNQLPEGVNLIRLKAKHSSTVVSELARYLKQRQPEVMLVAKDRPGRAALKARKKAGVETRIVIRLGTNLSAALEHKAGWQRWLRQWPLKRGYRGVDHIVPVSQGVADDTAKITGLPLERTTVIRNPVITTAMLKSANQAPQHRWFMQSEKPIILAAGRLTVQKDFVTLLKAFAQLQKHTAAYLVILAWGN